MVTCPKCAQVLGEIGPSGYLETVCSSCRYKFQVVQGRLLAGTFVQVVVRQETLQQSGSYRRDYELRVERAGGQLEILEFSRSDNDETVDIRRGDSVAAIFSMRGSSREELLDVYDLTARKRYSLATPGGKSRMLAGAIALFPSGLLFAGLLQGGVPIAVTILGSGAALGGLWYLIAKKLAPTHVLSASAQASLAAQQQLLVSKRELMAQRSKALAELDERSQNRDQLVRLRNKMREVGTDMYRDRIDLVTRGIASVEEQMTLDRQLVDGYAKSITMLEIEYEAGVAADTIGTDASSPYQAKLEELKLLRERQAELQRQVSANDEVSALLRGPTP